MSESEYTITADDLRLLLGLWPQFSSEAEEAHGILIENAAVLLGKDAKFSNWCHLYELPIKQHLLLANAGIVQSHGIFVSKENLQGWYQQLANTPGQISALPDIVSQIGDHFDSIEPSEEETAQHLPALASTFGLSLSMYNTLRCVLYHGCFLNELIERVRNGDSKALLAAIRIDASVIGCLPVSNRISKAVLLRENSFFAKLKAAINGKLAKREQANFQKMRLVFEVLHETGAARLSDRQLHDLFVEELKLYSWNAKDGGNAKALRKFADTYMKKNATT